MTSPAVSAPISNQRLPDRVLMDRFDSCKAASP